MGPVGGAVGRAISTRRTGHGTAYVTAASGSTNVRVCGASGASPAGAAAREFVARSDANPDAHAGTTGCPLHVVAQGSGGDVSGAANDRIRDTRPGMRGPASNPGG